MIDRSSLADRLDASLAPFDRDDAPGLVVGVAIEGEPVYRRGFGLANVEHRVRNTPATRMRVGSVSKHVTCLGALLLAEEGRLDIDGGVRAYIPELPEALGDPTLRQLMVHSSGVRCHIDLGAIADGPAVHPARAALAAQLRQTRVNFPSGERMVYSNGGYQLLSEAMERVSGLPFEMFMRRRVFEPLAMAHTASVQSDFDVLQGLAGLYVPTASGGYRRGVFVAEGLRGEGAMISTIDDMLRWIAHLRSPGVLGGPQTWRELLTPVRLSNGFQSDYGLGLIIDRYRGVDLIHHNGSVTGGTAEMFTAPAHALDIIVMTNGAAGVERLSYEIIDILLEQRLERRPPAARAAKHRALTGRFHCTRTGMVLGVEDMDGTLGLSILANPPQPMAETDAGLVLAFTKTSVGHFVIGPEGLGEEARQPSTITVWDSGNPDIFTRLPERGPDAVEVASDLAGEFYAYDIDADARFELKDGRLMLHIHGPYGESAWRVEPLGCDVYACEFDARATPWMGVLDILRAEGAVSGFAMNTARTRNLTFDRRTPA